MKKWFSQVSSLRRGTVAKQTAVVYFGQGLQAVMGFAISILLLRGLSLDDYGAFSVFMSLFMLLAGLSHWGWTETFVRFGSAQVEKEDYASLESYFRGKILLFGGLSALALAVAAPYLAGHVYQRADWRWLIWLACITGFLTCLFSFEMNRIRIWKRFWLYFSTLVGGSLLRLLGLGALALAGALGSYAVIGVYLASTLAMIGFIFVLLPPARGGTPFSAQSMAEVGSYNRWILASIVSTTLASNLDVHFLAYFHGSAEVAKLGAASRLTLPISILVGSLTTTVLPRLSREPGNTALFQFYRRKLFLLLPALVVIFALGSLVVVPLLTTLAGKKYGGLEHLLFLQLASVLVVLVANPFGLMVLAKGWIKPLALMNIVQLALGAALQLLLVPRYGPVGSVCATIGTNLLGMTVTLLLARKVSAET